MTDRFLIVGLGNPGECYQGTRHNIGFAVLDVLAKRRSLRFGKKSQWRSLVAEGNIGRAEVLLLMPQTFMNLSGEAVAAVSRFFHIEPSHILVVADDVAIPVGQLRMRPFGGSGGHNGLKSIESCLQTQGFLRLRIGVGDRLEGDLASHVLGRFSPEETQLVPKILERAAEAIELWLEKGLNHAMEFANQKNTDST